MNDLDQFDQDETTSQTIETLPELTTQEDYSGFTDDTSIPTTDEEAGLTTTEKKSKSKLLPVIAGGGALAVIALGGLTYFLSGTGNDQIEPEQADENIATASAEEDAPSLQPANESAASEEVKEEASAPQTDETAVKEDVVKEDISAPAPAKEDTVVENKVTEEVKTEPAVTEKPETEVKDSFAVKEEVTASVQEPVVQETVNNQEAVEQTNKARAEELREQAKRILEEADSIEKQSKLDNELAGKSLEEQVAYLKQKLVATQNAITQKNMCVAPAQKKSKLIKKKPLVKKQKAKSADSLPTYEVRGIVEGQIWVNDGKGTNSYTVGDKLPNGSVIKGIYYDKKTIVTNKGTFRVK